MHELSSDPENAQGRPQSSAAKLLAVSMLWLAVVLSGTFLLLRYSQTSGAAGQAPAQWPSTAAVPHDSRLPTLLMFLHPQCPCSSASLSELEKFMAHCQGLVTAKVLFIQPAAMTDAWVQSSLWHAASAIPGVSVCRDHDGVEARRFHALTSGQALLYDVAGSLRFQGGITQSRGHAGDNAGRDALESLVRNHITTPAQTPVFGCALGVAEIQQECLACQP